MKPGIAAEVHAHGGTLAGSIITLEAGERFAAARDLVESGAGIHADVFGVGYALMEGASGELLMRIAREWPRQLDVHVMADDAQSVIEGFALSRRVQRITVHARPGDDLGALRLLVGSLAD